MTPVPETDGVTQLVIIQPTPYCNLDCRYCYLPGRTDRTRMDVTVLEKALERVFESSTVGRRVTFVWHAGEPLVVPIDFYEYAFATAERLKPVRLKIDHSFQTNGTLINDAWCDLFLRHPVSIGVSVDGPAFLHDAERRTRKGAGTHDRVMRGIGKLKERDIPFHVITVLTDRSLDHADELYAFYRTHGIQRVGFNVEDREGANRTTTLGHDAAFERVKSFMKRFRALALSDLASPLWVRELSGLADYLVHGRLDGSTARCQESHPFRIVNIDVRGGFSTYSPELLSAKTGAYPGGDFILGNVMDVSFDEALRSEKLRLLDQDIAAGVDSCRAQCPYFGLCGGGTASNKFFENGTFRSTTTVSCRLSKQAVIEAVLEDLEERAGLTVASRQ